MAAAPLQFALVGTGWAAEMMATAAATLDCGALTAVVGRRVETAAPFAARFGVPQCLSHIDELPPPERCPLVVVCVPPAISAEIARSLLLAGYHVLLEKPGATSAMALARLGELGASTLRRLVFGYQLSHDRWFCVAGRVVRRARAHGPMRASFRMHVPFNAWTAARRSWAWGSGAPSIWIECGVHLIQMAQRMFGPLKVVAASNLRIAGQCVAGTAMLTHGDDVAVTLDVSYLTDLHAPRGGLEIQSPCTTVRIDRGTYFDKRSALFVGRTDGACWSRDARPETGTRRMLKAVLESCRASRGLAGVATLVGYDEALDVLTLAAQLSECH